MSVVVLAACSSSGGGGKHSSGAKSGGSGSSLTAIRARLAQAGKPVSFKPPGQRLSVGDALKGKSVWYVEVTSNARAETYAKGVHDAADALGMTFHSCNGNATPTGATSCLDQARNSHASLVIDESISTTLAGPALDKLRAANVPVVYADNGPPTFDKAPTPSALLAYVTSDQDNVVELGALSVIAAKSGKANIVMPYPHGVPLADAAAKHAQQVVAANCPDCHFYALPLDLTAPQNWASATSSALLRHSDVNAAVEFSDAFDTATLQGARTAGKDLVIASGSASLAGLQNVKNAKTLADPGSSAYAQGWAYVDQGIRLVLHKPAVDDYTLPNRVFTKDNVGDLDLTPSAYATGKWFGLDPKALYLANWGVTQ